jgi:hypothetical protein
MLKRFLLFRTMIAGAPIRWLWMFGAGIITAAAGLLVGMAHFGLLPKENLSSEEMTQVIVIAVGLVTVGNVVWRWFCETLIVSFRIHESVARLEQLRALRRKGSGRSPRPMGGAAR